jgi:DUF971 family protein/molybdopterin converting factor small subunit
MNEPKTEKTPREISLHSKSRLLVIEFNDGRRFELPCEYLRVFSRAKEVRTQGAPVTGKERVNITAIEPQGQYAVRLLFDDGHDTGIYSWDTLYELGEHYQRNWQAYLARLEVLGHVRDADGDEGARPRHITLLYFTYLAEKLRKTSEEVEIPPEVADVEGLVGWLRRRHREKAHLFADDSFQVTVNKQFSKPFTRLEDGDEVALIPTSPIAPPAPRAAGR